MAARMKPISQFPKRLLDYALVKDWALTEVVQDEGYSAKSLERPGM
jgi:hypothetical protein